jgi:hypothetical protein
VSNSNNNGPLAANNSGMNKGREYNKPWLNGAKNPNAKPAEGD